MQASTCVNTQMHSHLLQNDLLVSTKREGGWHEGRIAWQNRFVNFSCKKGDPHFGEDKSGKRNRTYDTRACTYMHTYTHAHMYAFSLVHAYAMPCIGFVGTLDLVFRTHAQRQHAMTQMASWGIAVDNLVDEEQFRVELAEVRAAPALTKQRKPTASTSSSSSSSTDAHEIEDAEDVESSNAHAHKLLELKGNTMHSRRPHHARTIIRVCCS